MQVQIINQSRHELPEYATPQSAGLDLRANINEPLTLQPQSRAIVPTGLYIAVPVGYEAQIRARSGLSIKHGITLANGTGTIDADYRGEVGVILANISNQPYTVQDGERIAQMVFNKVERVTLTVVNKLDDTSRSTGGFGSTGKV